MLLACSALKQSWRFKILLKIVLPCSWPRAKAEHRTEQGIGPDLWMFSFYAWFDKLHWLGVPKDKGKAPVSQSRANKVTPMHVVNLLHLVHRKAHNPVWDDGESRDMVNQNILGFWISTPFPAQLWVCWRTSLPACKTITKGIPTLFCYWPVCYKDCFSPWSTTQTTSWESSFLKKMLWCCWGAWNYLASIHTCANWGQSLQPAVLKEDSWCQHGVIQCLF